MTTAVSTSGLEVRYGGRVGLQHVDLALPTGSSLAVIGPNGSGKSTLLSAIAGTLEPSAGTLHVAGPCPAFVLQSTTVDKSLPITVRDTVALARYPTLGLFRRFRSTDNDAIDQALERLSVNDLASRQLHELSGGQRQRVLVAQGLAQESNVLLLDEPMTGVDATSRTVILDVIDDEVARGRTVITTTHNLADAQRCNRVLLLNTRPIALGTPSTVLTEDNLRQAFDGQVIRLGNDLLLEDPHHSC